MCFAAPVVTRLSLNGPMSGGGSISVGGLNFGVASLGQAAALLGTACSSPTWGTDTGIVCKSGSGSGAGVGVTCTLSAIAGSVTALFSFDGSSFVFCYCWMRDVQLNLIFDSPRCVGGFFAQQREEWCRECECVRHQLWGNRLVCDCAGWR